MLTPDKYWMGRDVKFADQLTDEIKSNATILMDKVNAFLKELGYTKEVQVSSGWRPAAINAATKGSAKASTHMIGMAVDIVDDDNQTLGNLVLTRPDLLKKYGLWMESLDSTQGDNTNWVHLDFKQRSSRDLQVFNP